MLNIPFVRQPDNKSCALACYTMVAKYFFPKITFEEVSKISDWNKGYVIWPYKFWSWITDKGIKITDYDLLDIKAWAEEGLDGFKKTTSEKSFKFYVENTKDINSYTTDLKKLFKNNNFQRIVRKPTFEKLQQELEKGNVCEVVLDSRSLRDREGFALHRVVVLGIESNEIVFHDPAVEPNSKVSIEKFKKAWLGFPDPELCIYEKLSTKLL